MKKLTISTIGVLISLCSLAQTEFEKGLGSVGIILAPSVTHYTYTMVDSSSMQSNPLRDDEVPTIGYQLGIYTTYNLTPKVELMGMLSYTQHGTSSKRMEARYADFPGAGPSPPQPGTVTAYTYQEDFLFFDVSLGARYYLTNGKIKAYVAPYVEGNYFLRANYTLIAERINQPPTTTTRDQTDEHNYRQYNYTAAFGAGISYAISKNISAVTEIKYRKMLSKVADELVQLYPYSIGLNLGIAYNL